MSLSIIYPNRLIIPMISTIEYESIDINMNIDYFKYESLSNYPLPVEYNVSLKSNELNAQVSINKETEGYYGGEPFISFDVNISANSLLFSGCKKIELELSGECLFNTYDIIFCNFDLSNADEHYHITPDNINSQNVISYYNATNVTKLDSSSVNGSNLDLDGDGILFCSKVDKTYSSPYSGGINIGVMFNINHENILDYDVLIFTGNFAFLTNRPDLVSDKFIYYPSLMTYNSNTKFNNNTWYYVYGGLDIKHTYHFLNGIDKVKVGMYILFGLYNFTGRLVGYVLADDINVYLFKL